MSHRDPRRRPRNLGPGRPGRPAPRVPRRLILANKLMADGRFAEAADSFARLSRGARRRGLPVRAANLAARASQAYLAQDRVKPAVLHVRLAIQLLMDEGRAPRAARVAARAAVQLTERGFDAQAEEMTQLAEQLRREAGIPESDWNASLPAAGAAAHGSLPTSCPGCGAPLIAGDVTWHDARTAECPYCGAVIKAE